MNAGWFGLYETDLHGVLAFVDVLPRAFEASRVAHSGSPPTSAAGYRTVKPAAGEWAAVCAAVAAIAARA